MAHILLQIGFVGVRLARIVFVVSGQLWFPRDADEYWPASPVSSPLCMSETRLQNREAAFHEMMSRRTS
jgi:hypothetical protein